MTNLVAKNQYFITDCVVSMSNDFDSTMQKIDSLNWINLTESDLTNFLELSEQVQGQSSLIEAKFWANAQNYFNEYDWGKKYGSFENFIKCHGKKHSTVFQLIDFCNIVKNISARTNGIKGDDGVFVKVLPIKERWTRELLRIGRNNQEGQAEVWKRVVRKAKDLLVANGEDVTVFNLQKKITVSMIAQEVDRLWEQIKKDNPSVLNMFEKPKEITSDVAKNINIPSEDHLDIEEDNLVDVLTSQIEKEMNEKLNNLTQSLASKQEEIAKKQEEFNQNKQAEIERAIEEEKAKIEKENAKKEKEIIALSKQLELLQDSSDEKEIERLELRKALKEAEIKENEEKLQDYIEDREIEINNLKEEFDKLNDPNYREQYLKEQLEKRLQQEKEKRIKEEIAQQKKLSSNRKKQIDDYEKALDKAVRALDEFLVHTREKLTLEVLAYLRRCEEAQTSTLYSDRHRLESMVDKINQYLDDAFINYTPNIDSRFVKSEDEDSVIEVQVA